MLELDLSRIDALELSDLMLELGRLPEGESLQGRLSAETWQQLSEYCEREGCDLAELSSVEPWLAALRLLGAAMDDAGLDARYGVERQLLASDAKEIIALETPREQFELFDALPAHQQELMLRDALAPAAADLDLLIAAWRRGDGAALEAALFGHLDESPELAPFYEATFFARNRRMAEGIEAILAEAPDAFVVLGAGHLVGERGVPALLERSGHRVRQVVAEPPSGGVRRLSRVGSIGR